MNEDPTGLGSPTDDAYELAVHYLTFAVAQFRKHGQEHEVEKLFAVARRRALEGATEDPEIPFDPNA